jgi:tRNA A37 methylthiotransferase MiaB
LKVYLDDIRRWCADNNRMTACLLSYFERNEYRLVSDARDADVMIVNACNITRRQVGIIDRCVEAAEANDGKVVVLGCPPWYDKSTAPKRIHVLPSWKMRKDPAELDRVLGAKQPFRWLSMDEAMLRDEITLPGVDTPHDKLCFLKVSSGCMSNCSFCAAPQAQGRFESASLDSILADAKEGLKRGHDHFVLVAKDNGCWGLDRGLDLSDLVGALAELSPEVRLLIPHLNPTYLPRLAPKLKPYLKRITHVSSPIQSGSAKILKAMRRDYDVARVLPLVEEMRKAGVHVSTSAIVGHPGETREDFAATAKAVVHYDLVTITRLVVHPGTKCASMTLDVPEAEVEARLRALERVCAKSGVPTMFYDDVRGL